MIQMIKMEQCLIQKVELFTMVSKMAAILKQTPFDIRFTVNLFSEVAFREFDWHDVVVFQRCKISKMSSKKAEIAGCIL